VQENLRIHTKEIPDFFAGFLEFFLIYEESGCVAQLEQPSKDREEIP
jgi:hypothetical protein